VNISGVISSLQYPECNKALQEITGKINLAKIDDFVDTIDAISDIQKRFYKTMSTNNQTTV